jgi:hypothetical protein
VVDHGFLGFAITSRICHLIWTFSVLRPSGGTCRRRQIHVRDAEVLGSNPGSPTRRYASQRGFRLPLLRVPGASTAKSASGFFPGADDILVTGSLGDVVPNVDPDSVRRQTFGLLGSRLPDSIRAICDWVTPARSASPLWEGPACRRAGCGRLPAVESDAASMDS